MKITTFFIAVLFLLAVTHGVIALITKGTDSQHHQIMSALFFIWVTVYPTENQKTP